MKFFNVYRPKVMSKIPILRILPSLCYLLNQTNLFSLYCYNNAFLLLILVHCSRWWTVILALQCEWVRLINAAFTKAPSECWYGIFQRAMTQGLNWFQPCSAGTTPVTYHFLRSHFRPSFTNHTTPSFLPSFFFLLKRLYFFISASFFVLCISVKYNQILL